MEDTRITFETAKIAKEKGWNGDFVESHKILTTQSLLAKWLRKEHEIDILVQRAFSNGIKKYILTPCFNKPIVKGYQSVEKNNYEEAYEICLQEALKLI